MSENSYLSGKRILVVDDEADILDTVEENLKTCKVVKASNFEGAKELLESQPFDLAVLDIMGVDGYGLLKIANMRKIPAVVLTAHAFSPPNLVRAIKKGAISYIPKEEITSIAELLNDILEAMATGKNPWGAWQDRFPSSYFERRWGAGWQDPDKEFWGRFKASLLIGE